MITFPRSMSLSPYIICIYDFILSVIYQSIILFIRFHTITQLSTASLGGLSSQAEGRSGSNASESLSWGV